MSYPALKRSLVAKVNFDRFLFLVLAHNQKTTDHDILTKKDNPN